MINVEYWKADDGTRFDDELECELYELKQRYTKETMPFICDVEFDGDFDNLYNTMNYFVVTNAEVFPFFARDMSNMFGFYFPYLVKNGQRYIYDEDASDEIPWQLVEDTWLDEASIEKLDSKKRKNIDYYLHGHCHEWVLENYQEGDDAIVWNEWQWETRLVHCYIKRGEHYMDVRGSTMAERLVLKDFDCAYDNGFIHCKTLSEYKYWIRKILHTRAKKWQD